MLSIGSKLEQFKKFIYVTAALLALWLFLIWFLNTFSFTESISFPDLGEVSAKLPLAVTCTIFTWIAIIKWLWKWWPFTYPFALGIPVLEGTWTGYLESDWTPATGATTQPKLIPIVFSIRQTALELTLVCFTKHQTSTSETVNLIGKESTAALHMTYIYTLAKAFQPGLSVQQGAGYGEILQTNPREFRGNYWTSTGTRGRIILVRRSNKLTTEYEAAIREYPLSGWKKF